VPFREAAGKVRVAGLSSKLHIGILHSVILSLCLSAGCAPRTITSPARRAEGIYHVIRPGENLFRIGKAYDVNHEELARVNGIKGVGQIRAGQRIFIPGATRRLPVEMIAPAESAPAAPGVPGAPEAATEKFLWPVSGTINSGFGPRGSSFHDGVDIAAPQGTPIRAIEGGEVIYSDQLRGYGNMVIVRHAEGYVSVYAHNEVNLVREGQTVARGEVIARVGSTGRVSGPHLHFEVIMSGVKKNPLSYL